MVVSLVLLIAARSITSDCRRLKFETESEVVPHSMTGPLMFQGSTPMVYSSITPPQFQMRLHRVIPPDDYLQGPGSLQRIVKDRQGSSHLERNPTDLKKKDKDDARTPLFDTMTTSQVLRGWADSLVAPSADAIIASLPKNGGLPPRPQTPTYQQDDRRLPQAPLDDSRIALTNDMVDDKPAYDWADSLTDPFETNAPIVHAVGLISKGNEIPFLLSGSRAGDTCVQAFGIFSRDQLKDDGRGSLRNKVEEMYGKLQGKVRMRLWWGRGDKPIPVLRVGGLLGAHGRTGSEKNLLSKINEYADKERRIVVLSKEAQESPGGTDITEYYVRLGFEKVTMEDGSYELVYTRRGSSTAADMSWRVDNRQIMVGMNP